MSLRTVAYWEAGRCRVPWSVVRLLRILRLGDLGALSRDWSGWSLHDGRLHSPEGRAFTPQESAWWALLVAQARAFVEGRARLGGVGAAAPREAAGRLQHRVERRQPLRPRRPLDG